MEVAIQWGAPYTYKELKRGADMISDWIFRHEPPQAFGVRIFGIGAQESTNSVVILGPDEPSPDVLRQLSELGGDVNVLWWFEAEPAGWR